MTSILRAVKRLFERTQARPYPANSPRVAYSYTIYWTKQVRGWDTARRAAIASALAAILTRPDFEPNAYERRYPVPGLDEASHSGESLLALRKVLESFDVVSDS